MNFQKTLTLKSHTRFVCFSIEYVPDFLQSQNFGDGAVLVGCLAAIAAGHKPSLLDGDGGNVPDYQYTHNPSRKEFHDVMVGDKSL